MDFIREFWKNGFRHDYFIPATPLEFEERKLWCRNQRKHTVVIDVVILWVDQMSILMGRKGFPEIQQLLTHSYTKKRNYQADIIITALGVPNYLKQIW
jgi:methylenetetrahydrofolate dehydrogenase (NADP+)/methenyltetrahydrofolate cyclohydrolase